MSVAFVAPVLEEGRATLHWTAAKDRETWKSISQGEFGRDGGVRLRGREGREGFERLGMLRYAQSDECEDVVDIGEVVRL